MQPIKPERLRQYLVLSALLQKKECLCLFENCTRSSDFVNHSYDYRPNWTLLSPITIINTLSSKANETAGLPLAIRFL